MTVAELIGRLGMLDPTLQVVMPSALDFNAHVDDVIIDTAWLSPPGWACLVDADDPRGVQVARLTEAGA